MPYLLRVVRKAWWYPSERPAWLPAGEVPATTFEDLTTDANTLSVWEIDNERRNLDIVIAGLAAKRDAASNFDYVLLDRARVEAIPVEVQKSEGESQDQAANATWHHDMVHLTGRQLAAFAQLIADESPNIQRLNEKKVIRLIAESVRKGRFAHDVISQGLQAKVRPLLAPST